MEEHAEIVRLLVDRGAAVHSRDDAALREAERSGNQEIIGILTC